MMRHRRYTFIFAILIVVISAASWTAAGFGQDTTATNPAQGMQTTAAVEAVSVLRQSYDPQVDRVSDQIAASPLLADGPVNLASARLVKASGRKVWLSSSADGSAICEITAGALLCPSVEAVSATGLSPAIVTRAGEPVHVSGITTDEVAEVTVVMDDGTTEVVPVSENYFTIDVPAIPRELRWTSSQGPQTHEFSPQG